jgi:hypothetical protein
MSYDLMVFDPKAPPPDRKGFLDWYRRQTKWDKGQRYDDPAVSTPELRAWFFDMIAHYPMVSGPYASEEDSSKVTDYSVGRSVIYAGFAWSEMAPAFEKVFSLAQKHGLGFFDVSTGNGGVWLPDAEGIFRCVHGQGAKGTRKWWQVWKR